MGVEYVHYMLVSDLTWIGAQDDVRRVDAVLDRWHLVGGEPQVYALDGGRRRKLSGGLKALDGKTKNLLVRYPHVDGGRSIAEVMGPSYFETVEDEWRYLQGLSLVIGTDFRIGPLSETVYVETVWPPLRSDREMFPLQSDLNLWEFHESYPADESVLPPETRVDTRGELPAEFTGVWRAGLILDCGKDLPRTDGNGFGFRVSHQFRGELETALGTALVEVGQIH